MQHWMSSTTSTMQRINALWELPGKDASYLVIQVSTKVFTCKSLQILVDNLMFFFHKIMAKPTHKVNASVIPQNGREMIVPLKCQRN